MPPPGRIPPLVSAPPDKLKCAPPPPSAGTRPLPTLHRLKAITDIEDSLAAAEGRMRTFVECGLASDEDELLVRTFVNEIQDVLNLIEDRLPKL